MKQIVLLPLLLALAVVACNPTANQSKDYQEKAADPAFLHRSVKKLQDVIVHDIFSPPVAARIYVYPSITAFEVLRQGNPEYKTLAGQLHGLKPVPKPDSSQVYCFPLAGVHAYLTVAKALIFSEHEIEAFIDQLHQEYRQLGVPEDVLERSVAYANDVSKHILAWVDKDKYKETRTFPKYNVVAQEPGRWQPTPPDYMDGIEPHWREIRTLVIDSAQQFTPPVPTPYNMDPKSTFYKEVVEVFDAVNNLDDERLEIAQFWDCNPYVSHHAGHVMFATKKITPGAHWIGIALIACKQSKASMMESARAYAFTSIALMDGFISCWDEKYRSNLIRPETLINQHIDPDWKPILQTPPFPEYTSGHSVISGAASTALTHVFGEPFAFRDTTELEYGLPARQFNSFREAADEAAISRLYGGIHYVPAIDNGIKQGRALGDFIVQNVQMK